jgi:hypothetical protein
MNTQLSLPGVVLRQRNQLTRSILQARNQDDLERLQTAIEAITPLWLAAGYVTPLHALQARLRKRAAQILLAQSEELSFYQPGKGLWESVLHTVTHLEKMTSN